MATSEGKQGWRGQNRFLNEQVLFKRGGKQSKWQLFEGRSKNGQLHLPEQQNPGRFKAQPGRSSEKRRVSPRSPLAAREGKCELARLLMNETFLIRDSVSKQRTKRAFSSKKFDLLGSREERKKATKVAPVLFRLEKKESNSKKSTDESSSTPLKVLRAENREYLEKIREGEGRVRKISQAIAEEQKVHELQRHLYNQNIERLRKIAGILHIRGEEELSMIEDEAFDRLSIESN